ncbi:MAG: sugar nucleotide-binding protein, partial [Ilumatobacteraceae bacterium]
RWQWVAPPRIGLDVRNREHTVRNIIDWKPTVVVHLAYRKDDASTIVEGSANVAEGAAACGARLLHLSSDMVFAGREADYTEDDRPDGVVDYGRWKAEAERRVADVHPSALLIRTSLLYGTRRLAPWQEDIRDRKPITWFTDEIRAPAHVDDVARAIVALASRSDVTGPLHVAGPEAVSRAGLTHAIAGRMHLPDGTVQMGRIADADAHIHTTRPGRIVLDSNRAATLGIRCRSLAEALAR